MDAKTYNDLLQSIEHWNEYRVPILRISQPDKNLNFQGAMRFYFQDAGQKVATKCVNVTSSDTTKHVIDVLIEKFRPDMRMLSVPEYGLYEIHENGDERKLDQDERPLLVQLEWNNDDREGRFLLRRMDEKTRDLASQNEEPSLKRKLSKKEKKKQDKIKKQQQKDQEKADAVANKLAAKNKNGIAERLYNELPETSFTRSISNPEAVMKRRRAQKLEKRLQEFSIEGGQEAGGTLRIFGETINKDVSYKTLLLSTRDTAFSVVKQILEKYGRDDEDPHNYCLIQLIVPHSATSAGGENNSVYELNPSSALRETILDDNDCPLFINQNHDKSKGILTFHIRRKPEDYQKRRRKKPSRAQVQQNSLHPLVVQQLNQRLQMNNNSEQYSDQNSPQNSSQTSGSINHDPNQTHFETVHSMPTIYPASNGHNIMHSYQPHSVSTLPPRVTNPYLNNIHNFNETLQRQNFSHHNVISAQGKQQFQPMVPNNHFPVGQQQPQQVHPQYNQVTNTNTDQRLPALIQVSEEMEDIFLNRIITHIKPTDTAFRLAPTYVLYMVTRYRASMSFHPGLNPLARAELFVPFTRKIATMIRNTIETNARDPLFLAFWLSNSSELSHFYKQDKEISHFTIEAQEILYYSIKSAFKYLLVCKQLELDSVLHSFFDDRNDISDNDSMVPILNILNGTMAIMRKNHVNTSLAIQIFSRIFHHIGRWLFDRLIGVHDRHQGTMVGQPNFAVYCNRPWGERLTARLAVIDMWAGRQGLERAAQFHLARVTQVTMFLARTYPLRITSFDLQEAKESCDRLNPVQKQALLHRYQPEQPILRAIIENDLYTTDNSYLACDYPLEEDAELKIPFLLPDDQYSSEMIRSIPNPLHDFVNNLSKIRVRDQELCIFTLQQKSSGSWTVYFKSNQSDSPEIITIPLRKKDNSMGLSIIAARGVGQERLGIYIKNVVKNGAAAMDGRLQAGDQLLEVDGNSLLDITQEKAAELMQRTGPVVSLKIAKQAAIYHNLSDVISSVPTQTIVSPQAVIQPPPFEPPPPIDPMPQHQFGHQDRKLISHTQVSPQLNPVDRYHPHLQIVHPTDLQNDPRFGQFHHQPDSRNIHQSQHENQTGANHNMNGGIQPPPNRVMTVHQDQQQLQQNFRERQVHFQAPPPSIMFDDQHRQQSPQNVISSGANVDTPIASSGIGAAAATSPLKSPKKVSWVDTHPHQSLHTLIPPSPALIPSPTNQQASPQPEIPSPPTQAVEDNFEPVQQVGFNTFSPEQHFNVIGNNNTEGHLHHIHQQNFDMRNGKSHFLHHHHHRAIQEEDENDEEDEEDELEDENGNKIQNSTHRDGSEQETRLVDTAEQQGEATENRPNGISLEAATESLTLEDIDDVLSSKTHNNWLEDSAGVIGTQEVYNDPRQRIVREKERSANAEPANIEELSFKEKLKKFSSSG